MDLAEGTLIIDVVFLALLLSIRVAASPNLK